MLYVLIAKHGKLYNAE